MMQFYVFLTEKSYLKTGMLLSIKTQSWAMGKFPPYSLTFHRGEVIILKSLTIFL